MTIDVSKIKPGDVVGVRVLATNASGRSVNVRANGEFEHAWIPDHAIVSHTPAPRPPLKVGDRVRGSDNDVWEVAAIDPEGRGYRYVHFAVQTNPYAARVPALLSGVETWERV